MYIALGCLMLLAAAGTGKVAEAKGSPQEQFKLIVRSSPNAVWESSREVNTSKWRKAWENRAEVSPAVPLKDLQESGSLLSDAELQVISGGETIKLSFIPPSNLVDRSTGMQ